MFLILSRETLQVFWKKTMEAKALHTEKHFIRMLQINSHIQDIKLDQSVKVALPGFTGKS